MKKNSKLTLVGATLLVITLIQASNFNSWGGDDAVKDLNVPNLSNLDDKIGGAKNVILDNLPDLLANGDFSAYTVGSYIFPTNGDNPEGFGGGIGVNYSFGSGFELQSHLLWTEEKTEGGSYLIDFGPAYRYTFQNDSSVYVRTLLGYKTYGEDLYYGGALGVGIPVSDSISVMVESGLLLDYGGEHAISVLAGISYQF